jgi:biopolymer transport protein ExbD
MADLALLLLVFFMATTTTEPPKGVEVELPKSVTQGAEQDTLYITVSRNGDLYLDGRKMTIEAISDNLSMRQAEKDRSVAVTADRYLPYKQIAAVLEALRSHDFLNVVFMSQPREDENRGD